MSDCMKCECRGREVEWDIKTVKPEKVGETDWDKVDDDRQTSAQKAIQTAYGKVVSSKGKETVVGKTEKEFSRCRDKTHQECVDKDSHPTCQWWNTRSRTTTRGLHSQTGPFWWIFRINQRGGRLRGWR